MPGNNNLGCSDAVERKALVDLALLFTVHPGPDDGCGTRPAGQNSEVLAEILLADSVILLVRELV